MSSCDDVTYDEEITLELNEVLVPWQSTRLQGGDSKGHNFIAPIIAPNGALIIAQKVNNLSMNLDLASVTFNGLLTLSLALS